jgi:hypothetical protein
MTDRTTGEIPLPYPAEVGQPDSIEDGNERSVPLEAGISSQAERMPDSQDLCSMVFINEVCCKYRHVSYNCATIE